ncbi:hypothetical protein H0H92_003348, partial [Tricholoma furcatifolium]
AKESGVRLAIALRLADDGFDVVVNDVSANNLESLVEEIKLKERKSSLHVADVSIDQQVKDMVANVVKEHGSLDVASPCYTHFKLDLGG